MAAVRSDATSRLCALLAIATALASGIAHAQSGPPAAGPAFPPAAAGGGVPADPASPGVPGDPAKPIPVLPSKDSAPPSLAPVDEQVVEIHIEGNRHHTSNKIMGIMKTKIGRPFDQTLLEKDVRTLATKGWFVDVKTRKEPVPGGVIITVEVVERATLEYVKIYGNIKVPKASVAKQVDMKKGTPLDPYMVEEGKRKIEEYYKSKGFNDVQVTILEGTKLNDHGAIYLIHEGPTQKVSKVHFVGNTIASEGRLKTQIQTKPPILWLFKGQVDKKKMDEDIDKLTAYYRGLGFFRARIGREVEFNDKQNWLDVTFVIEEGPRYKVRDVKLVGLTKFQENQLNEHFKLEERAYLRPGGR